MFQVLIPAALASRRGEMIQLLRESGIATGVPLSGDPPDIAVQETRAGDAAVAAHRIGGGAHPDLALFPAMQDADVERVARVLSAVLGQLGAEEGRP